MLLVHCQSVVVIVAVVSKLYHGSCCCCIVVADTLVDATVCTSLWLLMSVAVAVIVRVAVGVVESF